MSEVYFGDMYEKPLNMASVAKYAIPIFQRLIPGVIFDILAEKPRVMVLLGGEARSLSADKPGSEPDMASTGNLEDNTEYVGSFKSTKERRNLLRRPKTASKYYFEPDYVYTFQFYDDIIDICDCSVKLPFGKYPLLHLLNNQPFSFAAVTKDERPVFSFRVFHELLVEEGKQDDQMQVNSTEDAKDKT